MTKKLFFDFFRKNYAQLILLLFLILQNKLLIKNFNLNIYGEYLLKLSVFAVLNALSFPGLYHFLRKVAIEKNDRGIILYFKTAPFILLGGILVLSLFKTLNIIDNNITIYLIGFVVYFFGSYEYVLLGRSQVNMTRLLLLFQSIIFITFLLFLGSSIGLKSLLYLHLILLALKNLVGWIIVFKHSDFSLPNKIEIKPYLIQKNLSEIINPIVSKLDNIILGNISTTELGLYNIFKLVPNSLKSNLKLFLIHYNNKLIKSKHRYIDYIKKDSKSILVLSFVTLIGSIILSTLYYGFVREWNFLQFNIIIIILFSLSTILKILNDLFWNYDIYVKKGKLQLVINLISKSFFVISLYYLSKSLGIFGIVISYLLYDLINIFFSYNNLKSNE